MKLCTVEGCERRHKGRGYCDKHWQNWRKTGSPFGKKSYVKPRNVQAEMTEAVRYMYRRWIDLRRSNATTQLVPEWRSNFDVFLAAVGTQPSPLHRLYTKFRGQPMGPDTFQWREMVGVKQAPGEDTLAFRRRYYAARGLKFGTTQLDGQLRKKFGPDFGLPEYLAMGDAQNWKCAICKRAEVARGRYGRVKMPAVDHDHNTGKVRALLCQNCNHMLGCVRDNRAILLAGVAYLDKHGSTEYPLRERAHADSKIRGHS